MARLLIVDDDPDILKLADKVLTHAGHQVFVVEDAMRAIDLLNTGQFDLLISDANMPLYSGFELIQTVRTNPRCKDIGIAMLTGLRERKDVEKAVKVGVDDYIVKPLDPLLLVQKVTSLLDRRQPVEKPEIRFTGGALGAKSSVAFSSVVEAISELGVVIRTTLPVKVGATCDLSAEFFIQLGEERIPPMKILSVDETDRPDEWRVQLVFLGAPESLLRKIRKYIFTHGASHRNAS